MFLVNGEILKDVEALASSNAFRQGDYVFTTLEYLPGKKACFFKDHLKRLKEASIYLYSFTQEQWLEVELSLIESLTKIEESNESRFLRLILFLDSSQNAQVAIHCEQYLPKSNLPLKLKSCEIENYRDRLENFLKIPNYVLVAKELRTAKLEGFDEIVITKSGFIMESSVSNIFFIKGKSLFTPSAQLSILNGVARQNIIKLFKSLNYEINEKSFDIKSLDYEECFLSNSLGDIRFVKSINQKDFDLSSDLLQKLQWEWRNYKLLSSN